MPDMGTARGWITILTFLVFLGICWWAFRPGNRSRFRRDAMIPFEESDGAPAARRDESRAGNPATDPDREGKEGGPQ